MKKILLSGTLVTPWCVRDLKNTFLKPHIWSRSYFQGLWWQNTLRTPHMKLVLFSGTLVVVAKHIKNPIYEVDLIFRVSGGGLVWGRPRVFFHPRARANSSTFMCRWFSCFFACHALDACYTFMLKVLLLMLGNLLLYLVTVYYLVRYIGTNSLVSCHKLSGMLSQIVRYPTNAKNIKKMIIYSSCQTEQKYQQIEWRQCYLRHPHN